MSRQDAVTDSFAEVVIGRKSLLGDRDDQPQVCLDDAVLHSRCFGLEPHDLVDVAPARVIRIELLRKLAGSRKFNLRNR